MAAGGVPSEVLKPPVLLEGGVSDGKRRARCGKVADPAQAEPGKRAAPARFEGGEERRIFLRDGRVLVHTGNVPGGNGVRQLERLAIFRR